MSETKHRYSINGKQISPSAVRCDSVTSSDGPADAIDDVDTAGSATAAANATAINSILAVMRSMGMIEES